MYWQNISLWFRCTSAVRSFYVRLGTPTPGAPRDVSHQHPTRSIIGVGERLLLKQESTTFPRVLCVCEAHQKARAEVMLKLLNCGNKLQTTISLLIQVHLTWWNICKFNCFVFIYSSNRSESQPGLHRWMPSSSDCHDLWSDDSQIQEGRCSISAFANNWAMRSQTTLLQCLSF